MFSMLNSVEWNSEGVMEFRSSVLFVGMTDTNESKAFYLKPIHTLRWKWQCVSRILVVHLLISFLSYEMLPADPKESCSMVFQSHHQKKVETWGS